MRAFLFILSILISLQGLVAQDKAFADEWLASPRVHAQQLVEVFTYTEVPRYTSAPDTSSIFLRNGYAQWEIENPEGLRQLENKEIMRISVVYTKFPYHQKDWLTNYNDLLAWRLNALFEHMPELNSKDVDWQLIAQTDCPTEWQAKQRPHGIVIGYREIQSETEQRAEDEVDREIGTDKIEANSEQSEHLRYVPKSLADRMEDYNAQLAREQKLSRERYLAEADEEEAQEREAVMIEGLDELNAKDSVRVSRLLMQVGPTYEQTIYRVLDSHPQWQELTLLLDWTRGRMSASAQSMIWQSMHSDDTRIVQWAAYNRLYMGRESKYETEGHTQWRLIEREDFTDMNGLLLELNSMGLGDLTPKNDIAVLDELSGDTEQLLLIADNASCIEDYYDLGDLDERVHVIVTDVQDYINPQYISIAYRAGGSLHTAGSDTYFADTTLADGDVLYIDGHSYTFVQGKFYLPQGVMRQGCDVCGCLKYEFKMERKEVDYDELQKCPDFQR